MSTTPIVNAIFSVNATGVTATPAVLSNVTLPTSYFQVTLPRGSFFASGFAYQVTTAANNVVTSISALGPNRNVSSANVTSLAATGFTWVGTAAISNLFDVSFNFQGQGMRATKVNITNRPTLTNATNLGRNIAFIVNSILSGATLANETSGVLGNTTTLTNIASTFNTNLGTILNSALSTQAAQDTMLQALITSNGPIITAATGSATLDYNVNSNYNQLRLFFYINNLSFNVDFNGVVKPLIINTLPLLVVIT